MPRLATFVLAALAALLASSALASGGAGSYDLFPEGLSDDRARRVRSEAIRRARVWLQPEVPVEEADLFAGDGFLRLFDEVTCDFVDQSLGGSVPKFLCRLESGEVVKVKFGPPDSASSREIPAEVAASRLLRALGFGADRMYMVRRLVCRGCGEIWQEECRRQEARREARSGRRGRSRTCTPPPDDRAVFDWVSVERRMDGRRIQTRDDEGWSWRDDLARVDPSLPSSSSRAEIDAFRLIATFIESVDNKQSNQRLVCLPGGYSDRDPTLCTRPFMMIHDLGATFGKPGAWTVSGAKFKLGGWQQQEIWKEPGSCTTQPDHARKYTFDPHPISEEGRAFLASLLNRLSLRQIKDLFRGVRAETWPDGGTEDLDVADLLRRSLASWSEAELLEAFDVSAVIRLSGASEDDELALEDVQDARLRAELRLLAWTTVFEEKRRAINSRVCRRQPRISSTRSTTPAR